MLAGAAPLAAQQLVPRTPRTVFPPQHSPKVMEPVNVHEIQAIAAKNVSHAVYEYASGGSEDDATLLGNLEAFRRTGAATPRHGGRQQDRHVARSARAEAGLSDHDGAREQEPRRPARRQSGGDRRARRQGDLRHRRQRARVHRRSDQGRPGAVLDGEHARAQRPNRDARLGAAQRRSRRDVAERDCRSSVHAESRHQHPQRVPGLRSRRAAALDAHRDLGIPRLDAQRLEAPDHRQGHPQRRGCGSRGEVRRERHHRVESRRPRLRRRGADA